MTIRFRMHFAAHYAVALAVFVFSGSSYAQTSSRFPATVKPVNGGVEVITYSGTDRLLQRGDIISWVATPDSENQVAVKTSTSLEAEILAKQAKDGTIALWVTRGNADPDWVFVNLSKANNGSKSSAGGPSRPDSPPSTKTPGSAGTTKVTPGSADDASMLHVLYIYDPRAENDSFRWGCEFDVYRINSYLGESIPVGMYSGNSFGTPTQDADGLLTTIREYKNTISRNDSLLIYYSGHGSNDDQKGHMLDLRPGVKVARSEIRRAMQDTGARLCLLITDCCAAGSKGPLRSESKVKQLPTTFWNTSICRSLFFRHEGFVDVTSCGPGELAWSVGPTDANNSFIGKEPADGAVFENGGLFTTSLLETLAMHDGALKRSNMLDNKGRITWDSIKSSLEQSTESRFQREIFPGFRRQRDKDRHKHQTVKFLSTGQAVGPALPSIGQSVLGISFIEAPTGVFADKVDPDRTPAWVGIKTGDRLISVRRAIDSYYAHFWMDSKFTGFAAPTTFAEPDDLPFGYKSIQITSKTSLSQLSMSNQNKGSPELTSGMWIFSVERDGVPTEVNVRIVKEESIRYDVFTSNRSAQ